MITGLPVLIAFDDDAHESSATMPENSSDASPVAYSTTMRSSSSISRIATPSAGVHSRTRWAISRSTSLGGRAGEHGGGDLVRRLEPALASAHLGVEQVVLDGRGDGGGERREHARVLVVERLAVDPVGEHQRTGQLRRGSGRGR